MEWRSPRRIEEDEHNYLYSRFEYYMAMVDAGALSEEEAIEILKEEVEDGES